jgi:gamma-glutamyltranspeptidase/glutathione hydrolase
LAGVNNRATRRHEFSQHLVLNYADGEGYRDLVPTLARSLAFARDGRRASLGVVNLSPLLRVCVTLIVLTVHHSFAQIDRITGKPFATRSEVLARHGMVCTSVPAATQVGIDILKRGGSAVDAAIAANATLGLMEPVSNGIGGDLFAIIYTAQEKKLYGINGSGRSPLGLSYEQMNAEVTKLDHRMIPPTGMLPISVPGCVDAWSELHKRFGKLSLDDDLAGAIHYAEEGFPVTELIAFYWSRNLGYYKGLPGGYLQTYTIDGKGRTPAKGDIFKNPDLARTLRLIGEKGRDVYYKGEIADKIDAFMRANGGWLRKIDFEKHRSTWVEPVSTNYRGYDVFELPPNGQGIATLQILNILEGFDLRAWGRNSPNTLHAMIEAKKLAWADRAKFYADPDFAKAPVAHLISKKYATERRKLIDPNHAAKTVAPGQPAVLDEGDTIYLCTADDEGNMVSLIQSNFRGMGSGIVVPGLGFMFQDRGQLFSMQPGHANVYAPGKRPFHTIIPGFVMKDGKPWEAFGVMGGGMQPQGHVQVLTNQIDFDLNVQEAGDAARWQHEGDNEPTDEKMTEGGYVEVESGIPYETVRELKLRGQDVRFDVGGYGGYQAIKAEMHNGERVYVGASESRKDGQAAGY